MALTTVVMFSAVFVMSLVTGSLISMATSSALLAMGLAQLFALRARARGGRLSRPGLALILVAVAVAVGLLPPALANADNPVDLALRVMMYLGALPVVVAVLVGSRRRVLGAAKKQTGAQT